MGIFGEFMSVVDTAAIRLWVIGNGNGGLEWGLTRSVFGEREVVGAALLPDTNGLCLVLFVYIVEAGISDIARDREKVSDITNFGYGELNIIKNTWRDRIWSVRRGGLSDMLVSVMPDFTVLG